MYLFLPLFVLFSRGVRAGLLFFFSLFFEYQLLFLLVLVLVPVVVVGLAGACFLVSSSCAFLFFPLRLLRCVCFLHLDIHTSTHVNNVCQSAPWSLLFLSPDFSLSWLRPRGPSSFNSTLRHIRFLALVH
jgi:hypothetical protein